MIAPVVIAAMLFKNPPKILLITCFIALVIFILSIAGTIPNHIGTMRMDFLLYIILGGSSTIIMISHSLKQKKIS